MPSKEVPILGSQYIESGLYRVWPLFRYCECFLCNQKFRRQWLWKFYKRRKVYSAKPDLRYACTDCTSPRYNQAVEILDKYFRDMALASRRRM